ncbi:hypothetical protein [Cytophaga aurantiaca]|uniref:hypothetical protein n=1 Tax=Cytophaga aurantiaca TaxID=29530 RepID=UPI00037A55AD|nr:hypothetical protein [Cytophaga aurantiaca]
MLGILEVNGESKMKHILIILIVLCCVSCNSKQREYENALLFPERSKYGFDVTYNIQYFPDVNIVFNFSCTPSKKTIAAIESEFKKYEETYKKIFIHEMTNIDGRYSIAVNFNEIDYRNYSEFTMKRDMDSFDALLKSIDANPDIQDLLAVHFE